MATKMADQKRTASVLGGSCRLRFSSHVHFSALRTAALACSTSVIGPGWTMSGE